MFWIYFCRCFFFPPSLVLLRFDGELQCFVWILFYVCVSIVDFWFVVTMRFYNSSLYINKIVLSCWSFNTKCISNILHLCSPHNFWFWYYISVWMISCLYCIFICLYQWTFPFAILLLVVAFLFYFEKFPDDFCWNSPCNHNKINKSWSCHSINSGRGNVCGDSPQSWVGL